MASVEVSTTGEALFVTSDLPPLEDHHHHQQPQGEEIPLAPLGDVIEPASFSASLRVYQKSMEQVQVESSSAPQDVPVVQKSAEEEEEEGVEQGHHQSGDLVDVPSASVGNDNKTEEEEETKPAAEAAEQEQDQPVVEEKAQAPASPTVVEEPELTENKPQEANLAVPIPLQGARSRSFQLLPRGGGNKNKAYPMHRSLSFDNNKKKQDTLSTSEEAAPNKGGGGIPLFRRLSFRSKKEFKMQQQQGTDAVSAAVAPKPPRATPPKPPRPSSSLPQSNNKVEEPQGVPTKEEEAPKVTSSSPDKETPLNDNVETKVQQDKTKDADFEAALSMSLMKKISSLVSSARSKDDTTSVGSQQPKSVVVDAAKSEEEASVVSTLSKKKKEKKNNNDTAATAPPCGIVDELKTRQSEGKIQRTPTFTMEGDDQEEAPSAAAVITTTAVVESNEKDCSAAAPKSVPSKDDSTLVPKSVASKEESTSTAMEAETSSLPQVAKSQSEPKSPVEKEQAEAELVEKAVSATPEDTQEQADVAQVEKAVSATPENAQEEQAETQVEKAVSATPEDADQPAGLESSENEVAAKKDEASLDATEATDIEGDNVVKEEKNGLVVTSSASKVEVSTGKGFNFCEQFCCGLTLVTAPSD